MKKQDQPKVYKKFHSFENFITKSEKDISEIKKALILLISDESKINNIEKNDLKILDLLKRDLSSNEDEQEYKFNLKPNVVDEIKIIDQKKIPLYLINRYKYEIFPQKKIIEDYPPLLQIEPSSICNYRCIFCFETDKTFTNKKNGFMGQMKLNFFKKIIDEAEGKIGFITLASRGEPLVAKEINEMLKYTTGKFLNIKLNTNASLMTEKTSHAILSSGVNTLIFSADAADEELYSKLRVNGKLSTILKNIERFKNIHSKNYPDKKIITRISGVKFNNDQKIIDMENFWKDLVDQVAFVKYNPWENSYLKEPNKVKEPCSDLWRRMFIWWDGNANPCDVDYKSHLSVGKFPEKNLKDLWNSNKYKSLRKSHLDSKRGEIKPCQSCVVT